MSLTLWRGAGLVGVLHPVAQLDEDTTRATDETATWAGVLIPAPDVGLAGVWQLHYTDPRFFGVFQHPVEPRFANPVRHPTTVRDGAASVDLRPMSPEERRGVPRTAQFTVHDESGSAFLPAQIRIEELRCTPDEYPEIERTLPSGALFAGSLWPVFIEFASVSDAPSVGR